MLTLTLSLALLAPQGPQGAGAVVINEFSYDDSSTDDREFVELYNATNADIDISGWLLEATDLATPDNNADYTIPANTTIKAGAYYVLGSANVPNVNQIVGATNLWENDQEGLALKDTNGKVIDAVVYEANKGWPAAKNAFREAEGIWANMTSIDNHEMSWSRLRDGLDADNNGVDFFLLPATPGAANGLTGALPYSDNYDAKGVGTLLTADFIGSFADGVVVDPTVVDNANGNPNAIAASPQGGNAAIFWDKAGGGNLNVLLDRVIGAASFDGLVYLDVKTVPTGEHETWSIGFGTCGTFYNTPDPGGSLGFNANGNTGVSWTYQILDTGATLYLVDHNDGGWGTNAITDATVLAKIPVTTAGWVRLRLEINHGTVTASFGGTPGCADGQTVVGDLGNPTSETALYIGYREFLTDNSTARPVTIDAFTVSNSTSAISMVGTAVKTTVGTPTIGANSAPTIGNGKFAITLLGLVPSGSGVVVIGPQQNPPIDLGAIGGQTGSLVHVTPVLILGIGNSAQGTASLGVPIACNPGFLGATVFFQNLDVDPALPNILKLGNSAALGATFGQ